MRLAGAIRAAGARVAETEGWSMQRFAVNEITTYRWSFEEDVHNYVAAGIGGIGVWRQKLSDFGEEKAVELLGDTPLKVSSLLWAGGFTGTEGRSFKESLEDAGDAVRLAAALEASCLIIYTGPRGGHTHNHARRLIKSAATELAPQAAELGVVLAVEPMHVGCAAEWTFLTDLDETIELLDAVGDTGLKLAFDTYHMGHDPAILGRLVELAPRVAIVQLGDARQPPHGEQNRCPIGEGILPLGEIVSSLARGGYNGFYEVELIGEDIEAADYGELLAKSKRAYCEMMGRA
jgi:sugar phosphate isomerase/epimerase